MKKSNNITLRFPLTKGEGDMPDISQFSEKELSDIRLCLSMDICWEPDQMDDDQEAKILKIEFLYDGVTHIEDEEYGYWFEDEDISGYPVPIIRFELDREVDPEQFRTSIFTSSFIFSTESIEENDDDPYYAEDYNGYTSIITEDDQEEIIEELKLNNVFCGKKFDFPEGLDEGGYSIPGIDFIIDRIEKK